MPDNIPIFPDESNMERFRDFVNLQKELSELMLAQKNLYEQIGRINKDVAEKVMLRRREEKRMLEENVEFAIKYNELAKDRSRVTGIEADALEMRLGSLVQAMEYNQKMMTMAREASNVEMEMAKKRYEEDHKWYNFALQQSKNIFGLKTEEFSMTKSIGDQILKLNVASEAVAYTWGAVLVMLKGAYNLFNKMDKAAWDFRKAMGMTRTESAVIRKDAQRIAIDYMHLGVTIDGVYKAYQELGKSVGGVHNVTKSMVEDVALMSAQLGISESTSAGFLRNMAAISKNTMETQTSMMYTAQAMSSAAGVNLEEVMKNVADRSKNTLTMMSRVPSIALRSAIELQRMGTSLKQAASSSRHILDFTESVNEEMEASVLLGRSINLQRARELAYRRDLEGSTKEILRITKSVNFENLDVFQQEAFAKATGKSVDELLNMLQTDRQLEHVKRRGTREQQAQLKLYEKMRNENDAAAKASAKNVEIQLRTMGNQTQIARLQHNWNQLLAKVQQVLLPAIDKILGFINNHFNAIKWIAIVIGGIWLANKLLLVAQNTQLIFQGILLRKNALFSGQLAEKIGSGIGRLFPGIVTAIKGIGPMLFRLGMNALRLGGIVSRGIGGAIPRILMGLGRAGGLFVRILNPLGKIVGAFLAGWYIGKLINKLGFVQKSVQWFFLKMFDLWDWTVRVAGKAWDSIISFTQNWWKEMKIGAIEAWSYIKSVSAEVWAYIENAGSKAWNAVSGFAVEAWDYITYGLKETGKAIFHIIADPFMEAWNFIKGLWGGHSPSRVGLSILKGIASINTMLFKAILSPFKLAFVAIVKLGSWVGKMIWKGITAYFNFGGMIVSGIASVGKKVFDAFIAPYKMAFKWIIDKFAKIPFIGKMFGGGSVEKKTTAAYIPAVKVTPKSTEVAPFTRKPGEKGKDEKESNQPMSEATGQKICSLLEKILAKDNNIKMDGQLLSTHLARQTEFRGGYGVNKVA